jgi:hydrogenase-4 component B
MGLGAHVVDDFMSEWCVLLAIVIAACSGVAGLLFRRNAMSGQWATTLLAVISAVLGLVGLGTFWVSGSSSPIHCDWSLPGADFHVAVDGLSAIFLAPVFLIFLLGNVYGLSYWKQTKHSGNGRKLRLFYGTLTAGMGTLLIARNSILFLFGWEAMALSAYFLVVTEDHDKDVCETGWIYLVAAHVATLCLFALFALLRAVSGSFALVPLVGSSLPPHTATAIFALSLVGFGFKAGIMPLHFWLPGAHAVAPSHVSAIMSAVIIKMGVYGLLRVTSLLPNPPVEWGAVVLALGAVSGVLGVAYANGQHDLKRLLAYHSIENIGIITMGIGLALIGRSLGRFDLVLLGLAGGLLHVWNHAIFKSLLFLSAGSVIHAAHTREIDRLGGLAKVMPQTALGFLVGAVAICGLPPLNGFISELLIYLGLFRTLEGGMGSSFAGAAFAVPALAIIGTLATACFVKAYGIVFLGSGRSEHAQQARESGLAMTGPMFVLVVCCVVIGLAPLLVVPILESGIAAWLPELNGTGAGITTLAPLRWITLMNLLLLAGLAGGGAWLWSRLRSGGVERRATWACGYAAPAPRMQYSSSSFAQMVVALFAWALRPRVLKPGTLPLFPRATRFQSEVPDTVLDDAVLPTLRFGAWLLSWFRVFQQGSTQAYLLYLFVALIALLLWR